MPVPELIAAVLLAPVGIVLMRRLFTFIDEGAEYERELRDLETLGMAQFHGRSISSWVRRLRVSPSAVAEYRRLRG